MSLPRWDDDDRLFADLTEALRPDPEMEDLRRQGEQAFAWRTVDRELAALVYDSLLDDGLLARARSRAERRIVTFQSGTLRLELELTADGIVGQVTPSANAVVQLTGAGGVQEETGTDETGSFVLDRPLTSPVRLHVIMGDHVLTTDWLGL